MFTEDDVDAAFDKIIHNPVQNGWDTHTKLAIISAFFLVFNEITLSPIDSSLPLFNVEYVRLSDRFCGRDNIEIGGRGKGKQKCPRPKNPL